MFVSKRAPPDVAPIKIDSEEQKRIKALRTRAINADQQPVRLSVARGCTLTLGMLKKLCIIQRAH